MRDEAFAATTQLPMLANLPFDLTLPEGDLDKTIRPDLPLEASGGQELSTLPMLALGEEREDGQGEQDLQVIGELGQGGMGVVKLARQRSLRREVAVKLLKSTASAQAAAALLREASLAGGLEHPNIVPIHALGLTHQGAPALVMKRIEGVDWRALICEPEHPRRALVQGDPLAWHLDVLLRVAQAVEFAHARGIIHRDIKPENVMIGEFGEVYLLDWGIALELGSARPAGRGGLVGTPAYLAPEMAEGDLSKLSARTDVYLLGAVLHEILTGDPPHTGGNAYAVILSAWQSAPFEFDADTPEPLAQIRNKAMSANPEDRHPSAAAFAEDIRRYLHHRESLRLADEAAERLADLEAALAVCPRDKHQSLKVHGLFGACRFGFQYALAACPGNDKARADMNRAIAMMARAEIEDGHDHSAELLLHELPDPPPDLLDQLQALKARLDAERAELEALRAHAHYLNCPAAARQRLAMAVTAALFLVAAPLLMGVLQRLGVEDLGYDAIVAAGFVGLTALTVVTALCRRCLKDAWNNRAIIFSGLALFTFCLVLRALGAALHIPLHHELLVEMLVIGYTVVQVGLYTDRRLLLAALIYLSGLIPAALFPDLALFIVTGCNALALGLISLVWRATPQPAR